MDPFALLEKEKDPNYAMHCYDCKKGLDYSAAEYFRSRTYCRDCFCGSCKKPFDKARRIPVTNRNTGHKVIICPKCLCVKCKIPIVNIPFVNTNKGRCCRKCSCKVCNAAPFIKQLNGKQHCQQCICQGCSGSLEGGFSFHEELKYCKRCKPGASAPNGPKIPVAGTTKRKSSSLQEIFC
mmetsp:Transcript_13308/g.16737  ORF Transcript_13308/g.16737 Transcript_13308/m.16737 type:complete len:180 (-) Transcript_13308:478-1017(-)